MLIYLDSSQIAWLERAEESELERFLSLWADLGCELGLSLSHLIEMGQLDNRENVAARTHLLQMFPVIRSSGMSSADVARAEIRNQLLSLAGGSPIPHEVVRETLFPLTSATTVQGATVGGHEIFRFMASAFETGAKAERLSKAAYAPLHTEKLPAELSESQIAEAWLLLTDEVGSDPAVVEPLSRVFQQVVGSFHTGGTFRDNLIRIYGLDGLVHIRRIPGADLPLVSVYVQTAGEEAELIAKELDFDVDPTDLVAQFDPYALPGISLRLAVNRARKANPKLPESGDQVDEDHVMFAPYVDVLFTDKRIATFARQEARRSHGLLNPVHVMSVRKAANLDEVIRIVQESHVGKYSEREAAHED